MEKTEEKTDEEIKEAYKFAWNLARKVYSNFRIEMYRPYLDVADFAQEGILAWLEGRNMYFAMIDFTRAHSCFPRWHRKNNDLKDPIHVSFDERMVESDSNPEDEAEMRIDAAKIRARINQIEDADARFAVLGKLYFGMSYRELADVIRCSHERVRKLVDEHVQKIKKELEQ